MFTRKNTCAANLLIGNCHRIRVGRARARAGGDAFGPPSNITEQDVHRRSSVVNSTRNREQLLTRCYF